MSKKQELSMSLSSSLLSSRTISQSLPQPQPQPQQPTIAIQRAVKANRSQQLIFHRAVAVDISISWNIVVVIFVMYTIVISCFNNPTVTDGSGTNSALVIVVVDAVNDGRIYAVTKPQISSSSSSSSSTRQCTKQPPQLQPQPQYPWSLRSRLAVVVLSVQSPILSTSRKCLYQNICKSSQMDSLKVLTSVVVRGGGGGGSNSHNGNNYNYNNPSADKNNDDDWSNVNNNRGHNDEDYMDDNDHDDEYGRSSVPRMRKQRNSHGSSRISQSFSQLPNMLQKVDRKTGLMLVVSGISVTFLGITLFFNKTIIRLGHLLCIVGVLLSMGLSQTIQYFVQPEKLRATICLGMGLLLVFIGSPLFGIALEIFGILNLFGNLFPIVLMMMKQMPVVGTIFKSTNNNNNNNPSRSSSRRRNDYDDDDYYSNNDSRRRQSQLPNHYDYDNRDDYSRENDEGLGRRY